MIKEASEPFHYFIPPNSQNLILESLPVEIFFKIFSLDKEQKSSFVCKQWQEYRIAYELHELNKFIGFLSKNLKTYPKVQKAFESLTIKSRSLKEIRISALHLISSHLVDVDPTLLEILNSLKKYHLIFDLIPLKVFILCFIEKMDSNFSLQKEKLKALLDEQALLRCKNFKNITHEIRDKIVDILNPLNDEQKGLVEANITSLASSQICGLLEAFSLLNKGPLLNVIAFKKFTYYRNLKMALETIKKVSDNNLLRKASMDLQKDASLFAFLINEMQLKAIHDPALAKILAIFTS